MKFLFSTGSLYTYGTARCFELAATTGFDGIELMVDARWDTRQPAYIRQLIDCYHLPVLVVHSPLRPCPGWPGDRVGELGKTAELAQAVGAERVVHHLPINLGYGTLTLRSRQFFLPLPGWDMEGDYRRWLQDGYAHFAAAAPVEFCIENMPATRAYGRRWNLHRWNTPEGLKRFSKLTLDTTHLGTWGLDPTEVYNALGERVRHVHLSNYNGREHRRPEDGHLVLDRFVNMLAANGYSGTVTIELNPESLEVDEDMAQSAVLLEQSLNHCRTWARGGE